jgi:predicted AAA+ superfamily ATPase
MVALEGPRGAGKTKLVERECGGLLYVNFEDTRERRRAREDAEGYLKRLRRGAVLDEAWRAPELVEYLRGAAWEGQLVLVSSVKLGLGVETLELHGPTLAERQRRVALGMEMLGRFVPKTESRGEVVRDWTVGMGWPESDLAMLVGARDIDRMMRFVEVARGWSGRGLDVLKLARETGVSHRTAVRWVEALDKCGVVVQVKASGETYGRRVVRRGKLHWLRESKVFESEVVSELYRNACHRGERVELEYWRDSNGLEMELVWGEVGVAIAEVGTPEVEGKLRRWLKMTGRERAALITRSGGVGQRRETRVLRYEARQL